MPKILVVPNIVKVASLIGAVAGGLALFVTNAHTVWSAVAGLFKEEARKELVLLTANYIEHSESTIGRFGVQATNSWTVGGPGNGTVDLTVSYAGKGHIIIDEILSRAWIAQAYDGGGSGVMPSTILYDVVYVPRMPVLTTLGCPVRVESGDSVRLGIQLHREDSPIFGHTVALSLNYVNSEGKRASLPIARRLDPADAIGDDIVLPTEEFLVKGEAVPESRRFRIEGHFVEGAAQGLPLAEQQFVENTTTLSDLTDALEKMDGTGRILPLINGIAFPPFPFAEREKSDLAGMAVKHDEKAVDDANFRQFDFSKYNVEDGGPGYEVMNEYRNFIRDQVTSAFSRQDASGGKLIRLNSPNCVKQAPSTGT